MSSRLQCVLSFAVALLFGIAGGATDRPYFLVLAAATCATAAVLLALRCISQRLWDFANLQNNQHEALCHYIRRVDQGSHRTAATLTAELHAMYSILQRFPECTLPTSSWSMRFSNLQKVVQLLDKNKPQVVVELGSGISTICIAAWLRQHGSGRLLSFDHDSQWAAATRHELLRQDLGEYAHLHVAPLAAQDVGGHSCTWYNLDPYDKELRNIDMLIVDGPPAGESADDNSRLAAGIYFGSRLAKEATVLLDDSKRPGEKTIADDWASRLPGFSCASHNSLTGLLVMQRMPCENQAADSPERNTLVAPSEAHSRESNGRSSELTSNEPASTAARANNEP